MTSHTFLRYSAGGARRLAPLSLYIYQQNLPLEIGVVLYRTIHVEQHLDRFSNKEWPSEGKALKPMYGVIAIYDATLVLITPGTSASTACLVVGRI